MKPLSRLSSVKSYDEEEVLKGLRRSIDLIGGIENFVRRVIVSFSNPISFMGKLRKKL